MIFCKRSTCDTQLCSCQVTFVINKMTEQFEEKKQELKVEICSWDFVQVAALWQWQQWYQFCETDE